MLTFLDDIQDANFEVIFSQPAFQLLRVVMQSPGSDHWTVASFEDISHPYQDLIYKSLYQIRSENKSSST